MTSTTFADLANEQVAAMLRAGQVVLDHGIATSRLRSDSPALAEQLRQVYRHYRAHPDATWVDLDLRLLVRRPAGRFWRPPEARLYCDGVAVFQPFPRDAAMPLLEWGANYLIARRTNDLLLLHAGVVERDGRALVLPALPGSGKSTLTAALSLRGWRLLSDEFGAYDPAHGAFRAALKPIALKNESIAVIRKFAPAAEIGPEFEKTHKGTVAHLAPSAAAVHRVHDLARPGAVVFPRWREGASTQLEAMPKEQAFSALAFNAFNYAVLGETGFRIAVGLARDCPSWRLVYSDLDDAIRTLDALWSDLGPIERGGGAGASRRVDDPCENG